MTEAKKHYRDVRNQDELNKHLLLKIIDHEKQINYCLGLIEQLSCIINVESAERLGTRLESSYGKMIKEVENPDFNIPPLPDMKKVEENEDG
jgi:hypothetical protein